MINITCDQNSTFLVLYFQIFEKETQLVRPKNMNKMKCHKCCYFYLLLLLTLKYQYVLSEACNPSQNSPKGAGKLKKMLDQEKEQLESRIEAREKDQEIVLDPGKVNQSICNKTCLQQVSRLR